MSKVPFRRTVKERILDKFDANCLEGVAGLRIEDLEEMIHKALDDCTDDRRMYIPLPNSLSNVWDRKKITSAIERIVDIPWVDVCVNINDIHISF